MKERTTIIIGAGFVVLIILLAAAVVLFFQNQQNQQAITELSAAYSKLTKEKQDLEIEVTQLNDTKTKLEKEKTALSEKNKILEKDLGSTISVIDSFKELINTSMSWFSLNHNFNNRIEEVEGTDNIYVLAQIGNNCEKDDVDYCKIKSGCLPFINNRNGVEYVSDWTTTGKMDYLKDIITTLNDEGGDCEDQALLFVAEYNYLVDECRAMGYSRDEIKVNTFVYDPGVMYSLSYDDASDMQYYLSNSKPKDISNGNNYFYVVCGGIPNAKTGHCVVALAPEKIEKSTEIYEKLNNAPLIEPQTGQMLGYLNQDSNWFILENGQKPAENQQLIYLVIIEDDIIIFNYKYLEDELYRWIGYEDFYNKLEGFKTILNR